MPQNELTMSRQADLLGLFQNKLKVYPVRLLALLELHQVCSLT